MTKSKRKVLYKLINMWTRAEIMARLAPLGWPEFGDYHFEVIQIENKIRKLMYDTDNLVELGDRWGLPIHPKRKKRKKKKHC